MFLFRIVLTLAFAASVVVSKPVIRDPDDFCSTVDVSKEYNRVGRADHDWIWPNGVVPYSFVEDDFKEEGKEYVRWAMEELEYYGVHFTPRTDEPDYVEFARDQTHGCFAKGVGREGGKQRVNLGKHCMKYHIIMHELMHVLGFEHEQNRSDRDKYVQVMFDNIQPHRHVQFEKSETPTIFETVPYDFESIMHYKGNSAALNRNLPTIIPHKQYAEYASIMGRTHDLSAGDIQKLEILYPPLICIDSVSMESVELSELSESSGSRESSGNDSDYWMPQYPDMSTFT